MLFRISCYACGRTLKVIKASIIKPLHIIEGLELEVDRCDQCCAEARKAGLADGIDSCCPFVDNKEPIKEGQRKP